MKKKKKRKIFFRYTPAYELIKASKARGVWWRPSTPSTPTLEILGEVKFMDEVGAVSADNARMVDGVHAVNTFATQSSLRSIHSVVHFLYRERQSARATATRLPIETNRTLLWMKDMSIEEHPEVCDWKMSWFS